MESDELRKAPAAIHRRGWLLHCSGSVAALWGAVGLPASGKGASPASAATADVPAASAGSAAVTGPVVLVLGDSLSAEYGLARGSGWVALLDGQLAREKIAARVVNASISGDTTSGGRSRLAPLLKLHRPAVVIIELGSNDALRGLPLAMTRDNLVALVRQAKGAGARVVLAGMQVPPNYGGAYTKDFAALFGSVARAEGAALVPFLLAGVADAPDAEDQFQADRLHPLARAHPTILANVWRVLKPVLAAASAAGNPAGPATARR